MKTKICIRCGLEKPISEFYIYKSDNRIRSSCKACGLIQNRLSAHKNREKINLKAKLKYIKKKGYDSIEDYYNSKKCDGFKTCTKCNTKKPLSEFHKSSYHKYGVSSICKNCDHLKSLEYHKKHPESYKKYRLNHTEQIRESNKKYKETHKDKIKLYRENNRDKIHKNNQKYRANNPEKEKLRHKLRHAQEHGFNNISDYENFIKESRLKRKIETAHKKAIVLNEKITCKLNKLSFNESLKLRRKIDMQYKLSDNMRARIRKAFKNQCAHKNDSTFNLIGCTGAELVFYMHTWGYTKDMQIDHIVPISRFDLTNPIHQRIACHYLNLQPLTATENNIKHDMLIDGWQDIIIKICNELNIESSPVIEHISRTQETN